MKAESSAQGRIDSTWTFSGRIPDTYSKDIFSDSEYSKIVYEVHRTLFHIDPRKGSVSNLE